MFQGQLWSMVLVKENRQRVLLRMIDFREIKENHQNMGDFEIFWVKVSNLKW